MLRTSMAGDEVAAQLREDPLTQNTPVVFLTAIVTRNEAEPTGSEIGGNSFLTKAVKAAELIATIEKILST